MIASWIETRIIDIAEKLSMGPFGSNIKTDNFVKTGVPVIRGGNLSKGRFNASDFVYLTEGKADELKSSNAFCGDIVFTHRGTLGQIGIIPRSKYPRYVISQSQMKMTCDKDKADPLFIYYYFKSPEGQQKLLCNVSQTGVPAIAQPLSSLKAVTLFLPSLFEQKAIAATLSCLDDKIELNNRMNKTFEEMARAIFKSWFVDFEPFQDGEFVDSELGRIPSKFLISTIGRFAEVIDCLHSKKPERCESGKPLLQLNNICDNGLLDMNDVFYISENDYAHWITRCEASEGDCVITNVGRVGAVSQIPEKTKVAMGRNMTCVRCKKENPYPTFLVECLLSATMRHEIGLKTDSGTILDSLNVKNIPRLRFVCPDKKSLEDFEIIVRPIRRKMEKNIRENKLILSLRDTLLPKLMSGEIRVPIQEE